MYEEAYVVIEAESGEVLYEDFIDAYDVIWILSRGGRSVSRDGENGTVKEIIFFKISTIHNPQSSHHTPQTVVVFFFCLHSYTQTILEGTRFVFVTNLLHFQKHFVGLVATEERILKQFFIFLKCFSGIQKITK